jgi:hypothetical protein
MFRAAFRSACSAWPQAVHRNSRPQPGRDSGSQSPHAEHLWLVNAGRTSRSSDPNLGALYASWRFRSYGALSRMARFSPALALTFLPGSTLVPFADLVMPFTRKSSTATQPWFLARSVVSLWMKSCRRRACRARSLAIWLMVRPVGSSSGHRCASWPK